MGLGEIGCLVEVLRHCGNGPAVKNSTLKEVEEQLSGVEEHDGGRAVQVQRWTISMTAKEKHSGGSASLRWKNSTTVTGVRYKDSHCSQSREASGTGRGQQ